MRVLPTLGALLATQMTRGHVTKLVRDLCGRYAANTVRGTIETISPVLQRP